MPTEEQEPTAMTFVEARPVGRELGRENLGIRISLRALVDAGSRIVHPRPAANDQFGYRT